MKGLWLTLAYLCCVVGFGWLALAMESHWRQVRGALPLPAATATRLRVLGGAALFASLLACLYADHPTMAALVWIMTLAAAALTVTFVLAWRPSALAPLVGWVRCSAVRQAGD